MKLRQLLAEISAAYSNHGDVDVLLSVDIEDDETTYHADLSSVTLEEGHADEAIFVRLFGSAEE